MTIEKLSPKQKKIFTWPYGESGKKYDAIICDGAVRSGKTIILTCSFIHWAMRTFTGCNFGICGKTVQNVERNIIKEITTNLEDITDYYDIEYKKIDKCLIVRTREEIPRVNYFYVFGGRDESSYMLIQGITLAGIFLDEVVLQPRSFVDQALARCSIDGSRAWFSCNPNSPEHWFYKEWILGAADKHALYLHFELDDNPILSKKKKEEYRRLYTGVFRQRYIQGLWVGAEGRVYNFTSAEITTDKIPESGIDYVAVDYGTLNATVFLMCRISGGKATIIKEYYYSGRDAQRQKTDAEYYKDLEQFCNGHVIQSIIIDPSAASFIAEIRRHGKYSVRKAKNDVIDGIRTTSTYLQDGRLKIHKSCVNTLNETGLYVWDTKKSTDTPIKENDHAMDAMRYFCYTVFRHY